jgi:type IV pilus assembly protein PilO
MAKSFSELSANVQAAILIAIAVAAAAFVFWYYALPEVTQRNNLQAQVATLKAQNDKNEAFRQEQAEYLSRIQQLTQQLETLRSIVPDHPNTDVFVRTIYGAGVDTGVHVRSFVAQAAVKQQLYIELPFSVRLDGTYYGLLNFFNRLAQEQRIVTVSGLTLGAPSGGGMGNYQISPGETVGANCVITTYYNAPAPPPGAKPPAGIARR